MNWPLPPHAYALDVWCGWLCELKLDALTLEEIREKGEELGRKFDTRPALQK